MTRAMRSGSAGDVQQEDPDAELGDLSDATEPPSEMFSCEECCINGLKRGAISVYRVQCFTAAPLGLAICAGSRARTL